MEKQLQTDRSLRRQFIRYVPLNVLGMLALSCYILADTFFVANGVGADGLTALNLVMPVYSFISGLGLLFGMGGATKYAIYHGANRPEQAKQCFTLTMLLCIGTGILVMLLGTFFAGDICTLLGADSSIAPLAKNYLQTIMLFAAAFITNNALVCFVRNDGAPHLSMLAMVTGSLSNVILDYLFIFPMGLGMFGAAIATCMAPLIGLATLSVHLFSRKSGLRPAKGGVGLRRIGKIVSIGFSAFVTEFSTGLVMLIFNFLILGLAGNTGVAAYGVIANLNLFAVAIFAGISEGVQPLISKAYGRGDQYALGKVFRWAVLFAAVIGIVLYLIVLLFAGPLALAFNRDANPMLTQLATEGMRLYFPLLLLSGINIVTASFFASISKAGASFLICSLRAFVLITVLAFSLSRLFGMTGVWVTMPCTELITFLVSLVLLRKNRNREEALPQPGKQSG
ncbi:MATE family efflux transporter [Oscillibacter sp.]|uniref:MATE family efflux transporter n=1 Tax=Oscillibacter sp. TaxID=1945593 RepID=UPI002636749E|nr:MATE family efflux transporter [Oscillibacter sp.]MDD3347616.1 MATE family efflux transporter [Oscillibacter sp.]